MNDTQHRTHVDPDVRTSSALDRAWSRNWLMHKLVQTGFLTVRQEGGVCLLDLTEDGFWPDLRATFEGLAPSSVRGIVPGWYVVRDADDVRDVEWIHVVGDVKEALAGL